MSRRQKWPHHKVSGINTPGWLPRSSSLLKAGTTVSELDIAPCELELTAPGITTDTANYLPTKPSLKLVTWSKLYDNLTAPPWDRVR